jgi:biopolymer transport protein ExbD
MNPNQIRLLVAPALASLILILLVCALVVPHPVPAGLSVPILRVRPIPTKDCFDGLSDRGVVIQIHGDGSTWINETKLSPDVVRKDLTEIYVNRQYKFVYMIVDPEVPFGEFADIYDKAASATPGLHIGLLTRQFRNQMEQCPLGSGCTEVWPHEPFNNYCRNVSPVLVIRAWAGRASSRRAGALLAAYCSGIWLAAC